MGVGEDAAAGRTNADSAKIVINIEIRRFISLSPFELSLNTIFVLLLIIHLFTKL